VEGLSSLNWIVGGTIFAEYKEESMSENGYPENDQGQSDVSPKVIDLSDHPDLASKLADIMRRAGVVERVDEIPPPDQQEPGVLYYTRTPVVRD
jgi:hypothetical protein